MPWHVARSGECPTSMPWAVIKDSDDSVEGCHRSEDMAKKHLAALYANEPDMMDATRSASRHMAAAVESEARIYPTGFEIRSLDATESLRKLAGRAVPYNTPTDLGTFTEEIMPGTFAKSIKEAARSLPLFLFHGDAPELGGSPAIPWPIGMASEWAERGDGLHGVWDLDDAPEAQRAARMARDGKLPYLSVRFNPLPNSTDIRYIADRPHLIRRQARLVSTSLVATPAYLDAKVAWVRSAVQLPRLGAPGTALAEWTTYLEKIKAGPLA